MGLKRRAADFRASKLDANYILLVKSGHKFNIPHRLGSPIQPLIPHDETYELTTSQHTATTR